MTYFTGNTPDDRLKVVRGKSIKKQPKIENQTYDSNILNILRLSLAGHTQAFTLTKTYLEQKTKS